MENLSSERVEIIKQGDTVTYKGGIWIIKNLHEDSVDLIDPMDPGNIAEGVKRIDILKEPVTQTASWETTPGKLLESFCESITKVLGPDCKFSKQGETFQEAFLALDEFNSERLQIIVENGINNGYEYIMTSDPEDQN